MPWKLIFDFLLVIMFGDKSYKDELGKINYVKFALRLVLLLSIIVNIIFIERYLTLGRAYFKLKDEYEHHLNMVENKEFLEDAESYIKLLREENLSCFELLMKCKKDKEDQNCIAAPEKGSAKALTGFQFSSVE